MEKKNSVFIAASIDGYIADAQGGLDWLHATPNPDKLDMGYGAFVSRIDALLMGRNTFETVLSFPMEWPYKLPVFVLTNSLNQVPEKLHGKVEFIRGTPAEVVAQMHRAGFGRLYIDGGITIQQFLQEDMIDEMIITTIPILLGGGVPLFSQLPAPRTFTCIRSEIFLESIVQNHFIRIRN